MVVVERIAKSRGTKKHSAHRQHGHVDWHNASPMEQPHTQFNLPFAHYAMIYIDDTGRLDVSVSPSIQGKSGSVFTRDLQQKFVQALEGEDGYQPSIRKPSRSENPAAGHGYEHPHVLSQGQPSCSTASAIPLRIGDFGQIRTFYETALKRLQQAACRHLGKEWIKYIEPKKQVKYPYKHGVKAKPPWWPPGVRHKEPDHLKTPSRLTLLIHILCNLGGIVAPVEGLRDCAEGVRRRFPATARVDALNEVFRVRELQERYENGEIDADTIVYVNQDATPPKKKPFPLHEFEPKLEPEETDGGLLTPALPVSEMAMPSVGHPIDAAGDRSQLYPMISSFGSEEQPRPAASFSNSPPALYSDISSPDTVPDTPASSGMASPHALPACDYMAHASFPTTTAEDQISVTHRPTTLPLRHPGNVLSWEPTFRQNMFGHVDYNTGQAIPQQPIPYQMTMAPASHVPELPHSTHALSFRTGSLGHPHFVSSHPHSANPSSTSPVYFHTNNPRSGFPTSPVYFQTDTPRSGSPTSPVYFHPNNPRSG